MANTKFFNQIQIGSDYNTNTATPVAIGDGGDVVIGKLQGQLFELGSGTYISGWNAATNTPTLSNSTIETAGNWYNVTEAGSVNFGAGLIAFNLDDRVYSNGVTYEKGNAISSDVLLADGQILMGQADGIGAGVTVSGDFTINDTGVGALAFASRLTNGTFDGTLRSGVQYFNTNISVAISSMVIGRTYVLYNNDTASHTLTVTGTSAAVIGGDALTVGLVQTVNAGSGYTFTLQNATTVLID